MRHGTIVRAALMACGSLLGNQANAQDFAPASADRSASSPSPGQQQESGDIVVTASKRGDNLKTIPLAVSSVSEVTLAQSNITALSGVQRLVPNLRFSTVTGTPQVFIRGVGGGGRNIGFDPRVGVYVDGVYIGNTAALDAMLVGVSQIEVLRGPQGFLFGASTDAGAINIVTKAPNDTLGADASVGYGRWNDLQFMGHVNVPLSDKIFADLSVTRRKRDGYIVNRFDGSKPNDIDDYAVRGRIRFQPTDDLTADLSVDYSRQKTHLVVGEPTTDTFGTAPTTLAPYTIDQRDPELDRRAGGGVSMTVGYRGASVKVTSITAYRAATRRWITDTDHSTLDLLHVDYNDEFKTFSQELTVASNDRSARLRYLAGLYFSDANNSSFRSAALGSDASLIGLPAQTAIGQPRNGTRIISGYASVDYDILPEVTLNGGVRVSLERRDITASQQGIPALSFATFAAYRDAFNETHAMPTASLTYKPGRDLTLYAKYARGVKSGGYNADYVYDSDPGGHPYRYRPETVDSYEAGIKTAFIDRRISANFAAFLNNFSDYQVFQYRVVNGVTNLSLSNAGKVRTYGLEAELEVQPIDGLTLGLNGSRLVAKYLSFPDGGGIGVDYAGNRLEYAPKWNVSAKANYTRDISAFEGSFLTIGTDYSYRGNSYADASNVAGFFMKASDLLSARIGIGSHRMGSVGWQLSFSGENLLKTRSFTNISLDGFGVLVGFRETPITYLAKLELHY